MKKKPELLVPAGNYAKFEAAVRYGADAVYLSGRRFGMRAAADNFSLEEMERAVGAAHAAGVRVYVTVNTMPRSDEYPALGDYLAELDRIGVDALIIADLGVLALARERAKHTEYHISTQAGAVSYADCNEWHCLGASRVVLSRELSLEDMKRIREKIPSELELEAFVHGSMCVSWSGRCLLSAALTGRDSNRGMCAQPCRWNYKLHRAALRDSESPSVGMPDDSDAARERSAAGECSIAGECSAAGGVNGASDAARADEVGSFEGAGHANDAGHANGAGHANDAGCAGCAGGEPLRYEIEEEARPGQRFPIEEDELGTFIMSSRDLCMIEHIPELCEAGIDSFKIEGRMKSAYYAAVTANAYRMAIDRYVRDGEGYVFDTAWLRELESVSHREYSTGYFFTPPSSDPQLIGNVSMGYIREKAYLAIAESYDAESGTATFVQRNKLTRGDRVALISPGVPAREFTADAIYDENGGELPSAPHPYMTFRLRVPFEVKRGDILRGA